MSIFFFHLTITLTFKDKELAGQAAYFLQKRVQRLWITYYFYLVFAFQIDFQVIATDFNSDSLESLRQEGVNENLDIKVRFS